MKTIKKRLNKAERFFMVLNAIAVLMLLVFLVVPRVFSNHYLSVNIVGFNTPVVFILNCFFVFYWLGRTRYYFLISLFFIFVYCFLLVQRIGYKATLRAAINSVMVKSGGLYLNQHDYIGDVTLPEHPRLLFTEADEAIVKQGFATNPNWSRMNLFVVNGVNAMMKQRLKMTQYRGDDIIVNTREAMRRLLFFSYAWRVTNKPEYLKAATDELMNVSSVSSWKPQETIETAEITLSVAIAYDWLYNDLSEVDRMLVQKAIIKKALEPSLDAYYNGWLDLRTEANQICNTAMLYGALAVYDVDTKLARQIINRSIESLSFAMDIYAPNGVHPSGYQYGAYGTNFNVFAIDALTNLFGKDYGLLQKPGFLKTGEYLQHLTGPTALPFNYSDGLPSAGLALNPSAFWLADKLKQTSLRWPAERILSHGTYKEFVNNRLLPIAIIWGTTRGMSGSQPPTNNMWVDNKGTLALMRTGWADSSAIFVGFKAGSPSTWHGHMDAGSFVLDANGKRWASELGGENLTRLQANGVNILDMGQNSRRWQMFRNNNKSHNTLTVNGGYQMVDSASVIIRSSGNKDLMYAVASLSGVYQGTLKNATRGIAIVGQKLVQVRDEIETMEGDNNVRWKIITPSHVKILAANLAELTQGDKKMYMRVMEPAAAKLELWSASPSYFYELPNPGNIILGFEIRNSISQKVPMSVVFSDDLNKLKALQSVKPLKEWK